METRAVFKAIADFSQLERKAKAAERSVVSMQAKTTAGSKPAARSFQDFAAAMDKSRRAAEQNERRMASGVRTMGQSRTATAQLTRELKTAERTSGQVAQAHARLNQEVSRYAPRARTASSVTRDLTTSKQDASRAASTFAGNLRAVDIAMTGSTRRSTGFIRVLKDLVAGLGAGKIVSGAFVSVLGVMTAAVATLGLKFNATKEQSLIAFTSILKSGTKAQELMARIVDTARITPFETQDLVDGVRKMLAYGIPLEKVMRGTGAEAKGLVITLGNAVSAMGGSGDMMQQVIRAIGQMFAKGKASAEELRQLAESGIPVYQILSQELGISAEKVQEIGKAGVSGLKAIEALERGLEKRFGGAMAKQSVTLMGLLSTLKDNITIGAGKAFEGLFKTAKKAITGVTLLFTGLLEAADKRGFLGAITDKFPLLGKFITAIGQAVSALGRGVAAVLPVFKSLGMVFGGTVLVAATTFFQVLAKAMSGFATILKAIPGPIKSAIGGIIGFSLALRALNRVSKATSILEALPLYFKWTVKPTMQAAGALGLFRRAAQGASAQTVRFLPFLKFMGSYAALGGVALVALAAGAVLVWNNMKKMAQGYVTASEATDKLSSSLDIQFKKRERDISASKRWRDEMIKFRKDNIDLITTLQNLKKASDQRDYLFTIAYTLVQKGADPKDAIGAIKKVAEAAGVTFDINFKEEDLYSFEKRLDAVGSLGKRIAGDFSKGWQGFFNIIKTGSHEEIKGLAKEIAALFDAGQVQSAVKMMAEFEASLRKSGLSAADTERVMASLEFQVNKASQTVDQGSGSYRNLGVYFEALSKKGEKLNKYEKEWINLVLAAAKANGGNLVQAIDEVSRRYPGLTSDIEGTTSALIRETREVKFNGDALAVNNAQMGIYKDRVEDMAKALESFTNPASVYSQLLEKVSDDEKKAAEERALAAGRGKDAWAEFARSSELSLTNYTKALKAQLDAQDQWEANLSKITERARQTGITGLTDLTEHLRDMGPEYSRLIKDLANAGPKEFQAAMTQLLRDEEKGMADYSINQVKAWDKNKVLARVGAGDSAKAIADELGISVKEVTEIVSNYGTEQQKAWAGAQILAAQGAGDTADAIAEQLGVGVEKVNRVMAQYATAVAQGLNPILKAVGKDEVRVIVPDKPSDSRTRGTGGRGAGHYAKGTEDHRAQIAQPGAWRVWAEPETGGEAYIPLAKSKRRRSLDIWRKTGQKLGAMEDGGIIFLHEGHHDLGSTKGGAKSTAYAEDVTRRMFRDILNREPDPGGWKYWVSVIKSGRFTEARARQATIDSAEHKAMASQAPSEPPPPPEPPKQTSTAGWQAYLVGLWQNRNWWPIGWDPNLGFPPGQSEGSDRDPMEVNSPNVARNTWGDPFWVSMNRSNWSPMDWIPETHGFPPPGPIYIHGQDEPPDQSQHVKSTLNETQPLVFNLFKDKTWLPANWTMKEEGFPPTAGSRAYEPTINGVPQSSVRGRPYPIDVLSNRTWAPIGWAMGNWPPDGPIQIKGHEPPTQGGIYRLGIGEKPPPGYYATEQISNIGEGFEIIRGLAAFLNEELTANTQFAIPNALLQTFASGGIIPTITKPIRKLFGFLTPSMVPKPPKAPANGIDGSADKVMAFEYDETVKYVKENSLLPFLSGGFFPSESREIRVQKFDEGGYLEPGLTLAVNRTGDRELVSAGTGGPVQHHWHIQGVWDFTDPNSERQLFKRLKKKLSDLDGEQN